MPAQSRTRLLQSASVIAKQLSDSAIWDSNGSSCSWAGAALQVAGASAEVIVGPVGASLYAGTSGIGLFLAELNALAPSDSVRKAALGAFRTCLGASQNSDPEMPRSFFSGPIGLLFGLRRGLRCLDDRDLLIAYSAQVAQFDFRRLMDDGPLDLMSGSAGAIFALLSWLDDIHDPRLLGVCIELADDICARAEWTSAHCFWNSEEMAGIDAPPLTGFAHGTSGVAAALLKMHRRTRNREYLSVARAAFAYEDFLFSADRMNWVDLRFPHALDGPEPTGRFSVAWCHGAAGIALGRIAALQYDPEERLHHQHRARAALSTTANSLRRALSAPLHDSTLCHGICGLVEILNIADTVGGFVDFQDVVSDAIDRMLNLYGLRGNWPVGLPEGSSNPSLMLGTAGIGHALLRLAYPQQVEPILLI